MQINDLYYNKYLKYKTKYLYFKNQLGCGNGPGPGPGPEPTFDTVGFELITDEQLKNITSLTIIITETPTMLTLSFKIPTRREIPIELVGDYKIIIYNILYNILYNLNSIMPEDKKVIVPQYVEELDININFTFNNLRKDEISNLKKILIKMKNWTDYFRLVKIMPKTIIRF